MKLNNVMDVAAWRLCVGCGACAYICPKNSVRLRDVETDGIRPELLKDDCGDCDLCLKVCPGFETIHSAANSEREGLPSLRKGWGPVLELWEGHAADPDIRYSGSSGGLASALALYCIEKEGMDGLLHVGPDEHRPYRNKTVLSRSRSEILSRAGSRYSPASPCDGLALIEASPRPCAFIGKPCDVAGLRKAQSLKPELDKKIGVAIGIFCAGTPSTRGTLELLKRLKVNPDDLAELRYRGRGWPGRFVAQPKSAGDKSETLTYKESWGFIQEFRPYRCYLCPDGTSEFADISCGDPWYREVGENELGHSLAVVRTERGKRILHSAIKAGYVVLERVDPEIIEKSQKNLLNKRGAIWGRRLTMKALGVPTPHLEGFALFQNWLKITTKDKVKSIAGTARRVVARKYYKKIKNG